MSSWRPLQIADLDPARLRDLATDVAALGEELEVPGEAARGLRRPRSAARARRRRRGALVRRARWPCSFATRFDGAPLLGHPSSPCRTGSGSYERTSPPRWERTLHEAPYTRALDAACVSPRTEGGAARRRRARRGERVAFRPRHGARLRHRTGRESPRWEAHLDGAPRARGWRLSRRESPRGRARTRSASNGRKDLGDGTFLTIILVEKRLELPHVPPGRRGRRHLPQPERIVLRSETTDGARAHTRTRSLGGLP
jgi:hypothetical protein